MAGQDIRKTSSGSLSDLAKNNGGTTTLVKSGETFAGVTGTGTTATITVANGVISAIALS